MLLISLRLIVFLCSTAFSLASLWPIVPSVAAVCIDTLLIMPPKKTQLRQSPAAYCPACMREYREGTNNNPTRRSDRTDRLCTAHAPRSTRLDALPQQRLRGKTVAKQLPKLQEPPAHYCPACMREYRAGNNNNPTRRSDRTDRLCTAHAPRSTRLDALPQQRLRGKTVAKQLPKLQQPPAAYCPACMREYRAGNNNNPTRRSDRTDRLCTAHAPRSTRLDAVPQPSNPTFRSQQRKIMFRIRHLQ
jgi:cytochrome c553